MRDDAFVVLRGVCENAARRRAKLDHIAAGELLMRVIRTRSYPLQELGNSSETGVLNAHVAALDFPRLAATKTALGKRLQMLTGLIDPLDAADVAHARPEFDTLISRLNPMTAEIIPRPANPSRSPRNPRLPKPHLPRRPDAAPDPPDP